MSIDARQVKKMWAVVCSHLVLVVLVGFPLHAIVVGVGRVEGVRAAAHLGPLGSVEETLPRTPVPWVGWGGLLVMNVQKWPWTVTRVKMGCASSAYDTCVAALGQAVLARHAARFTRGSTRRRVRGGNTYTMGGSFDVLRSLARLSRRCPCVAGALVLRGGRARAAMR
jgi:hypothetical protein